MPILREETKVKEYIEQMPKELTSGDIADVWLVVVLGALMYFGSYFFSLILKVVGLVVMIMGLYTIATHLLGT